MREGGEGRGGEGRRGEGRGGEGRGGEGRGGEGRGGEGRGGEGRGGEGRGGEAYLKFTGTQNSLSLCLSSDCMMLSLAVSPGMGTATPGLYLFTQ